MNYSLFIVPIVSALLAQTIKMVINAIKGKFSWNDLNNYGGMPSSHASLVISLSAIVGYYEGFNSTAFAISLILALIVIRDAGGIRQVLGKHATQINNIIDNRESSEAYKYTRLNETIGHTPLQLFFGSLLGIVITIAYILIF